MELKGTKSVSSALRGLQKNYADFFRDTDLKVEVDVIPTGSLLLDLATVVGGYPRGRISQVRGFESTGKTTHALKAVANLQAMGGSAVFIDTEYSFDPAWATRQGVNIDELTLIQPPELEIAGELAVDLAESNAFDLIIFDSVAGSPIKANVEGTLGDANMGIRGKIMSSFMSKLNGPLARNNMWMIFTNQLRDSLNAYNPKPVGPGGHALNFHSSLTIDLKAKAVRQPGKDASGVEITAETTKNKVGAPFKRASYFMDFNGQIDQIDEIAGVLTNPDFAEFFGTERKGSWYYFDPALFPGLEMEEYRFQGKPAILAALSDLEVYEGTRDEVMKRLKAR